MLSLTSMCAVLKLLVSTVELCCSQEFAGISTFFLIILAITRRLRTSLKLYGNIEKVGI